VPSSTRTPAVTGRGRLAARLGTVAVATCGVLSAGLFAAGGAQAADVTDGTVAVDAAALAPATVTVAPAATVVAPVTVVAPQPTATTLRASRGTLTKGQRVRLSGVVTVGAARARLAGARVVLQSHLKGRPWRTVTTRRLSAKGTVTVDLRPGVRTYYRLVLPAAASRRSSASRSVRVTVRLSARQKVLAAATSRIGKPYVFGAAGPNSFDCSGLTSYAYRKAGVRLPHSANGQKRYGRAVSRRSARPGDLVVFYSGGYAYHAAIYAGKGYIYEAARPGTRVGRHKLWSSAVSFRRLVA
jgi:cell wall-associated NlpC family hydrolase